MTHQPINLSFTGKPGESGKPHLIRSRRDVQDSCAIGINQRLQANDLCAGDTLGRSDCLTGFRAGTRISHSLKNLYGTVDHQVLLQGDIRLKMRRCQ